MSVAKAILLVMAPVSVFVLQQTVVWDWGLLGIVPRHVEGIHGILTFPFVHADWQHLFNNGTALLVLLTLLFQAYPQIAWKSLLWIYVIGGSWLWAMGREMRHIGASGVVYGLFGFLFLSGLLRRDGRLMAVSLMVIFLYGSMVWGIFPTKANISWDGHFTGLLAGFAVALYLREQGPQRKMYSWELEGEEAEEDESPQSRSEEVE